MKGRPRTDIKGQKIGKLTIVEIAEKGKHGYIWRCKCECGETVYCRIDNILNGHSSSKDKSCRHYGRKKVKRWVGQEMKKSSGLMLRVKENHLKQGRN